MVPVGFPSADIIFPSSGRHQNHVTNLKTRRKTPQQSHSDAESNKRRHATVRNGGSKLHENAAFTVIHCDLTWWSFEQYVTKEVWRVLDTYLLALHLILPRSKGVRGHLCCESGLAAQTKGVAWRMRRRKCAYQRTSLFQSCSTSTTIHIQFAQKCLLLTKYFSRIKMVGGAVIKVAVQCHALGSNLMNGWSCVLHNKVFSADIEGNLFFFWRSRLYWKKKKNDKQ